MRPPFFKTAAVAAFSAGLMFAQAATGSPRAGGTTKQEEQEGCPMSGRLERISQSLNLTSTQNAKAQAIFQNARKSSEPIRMEMRQNHEKLAAASKAANETEIQKLSHEQGRLVGELVAIRSEAHSKFYQMLTPEQRLKVDQMREENREQFRRGHASRFETMER
jgi:Spy/CpxP family protein refolding chaperone